eukprot:6190500-Pleurochrysis_carterae.AAC.3
MGSIDELAVISLRTEYSTVPRAAPAGYMTARYGKILDCREGALWIWRKGARRRGAARRPVWHGKSVQAGGDTMQGSASADSLLWQDMHAPHDLLPQLASRLHWQGEIILLNTNWGMLDLVANLIATLREFGHQH